MSRGSRVLTTACWSVGTDGRTLATKTKKTFWIVSGVYTCLEHPAWLCLKTCRQHNPHSQWGFPIASKSLAIPASRDSVFVQIIQGFKMERAGYSRQVDQNTEKKTRSFRHVSPGSWCCSKGRIFFQGRWHGPWTTSAGSPCSMPILVVTCVSKHIHLHRECRIKGPEMKVVRQRFSGSYDLSPELIWIWTKNYLYEKKWFRNLSTFQFRWHRCKKCPKGFNCRLYPTPMASGQKDDKWWFWTRSAGLWRGSLSPRNSAKIGLLNVSSWFTCSTWSLSKRVTTNLWKSYLPSFV